MPTIPSDPFMLLSFVNMKLRDQYSTLSELCDDLDIDRHWLETTLGASGFEYNEEANKFW